MTEVTRCLAFGALLATLLAISGSAAGTAAPKSGAGVSPSAPRVAKPAAKDTTPRRAAPSANATGADSASTPSFSGRWKLSIARSSFGKIPAGQPTARTDVIEHSGTRIRQTLYLLNGAQRDTTVYVYSTDGTPTANKVDGRDIRSTVRWEGRTLHLVSTAKLIVLEMSLDERWTLSPERRTLTFTRHVKYGFGEGDQTLVFERE